jgi:aminoglycoside 6'-N-acetyltransferase I
LILQGYYKSTSHNGHYVKWDKENDIFIKLSCVVKFMNPFKVLILSQQNIEVWYHLRNLLWPNHPINEHIEDGKKIIESNNLISFLVCSDNGQFVGFADASIRQDYVNGCDHSPVAYLEGIFILDEFRRLGLASLLLHEVEKWGKSKGCLELASDTSPDNHISKNMHEKLGFTPTETVIFFKKNL